MIVFASLAGIIYGLAYKYSKSLWISVLFHCGLFNPSNIFYLSFLFEIIIKYVLFKN